MVCFTFDLFKVLFSFVIHFFFIFMGCFCFVFFCYSFFSFLWGVFVFFSFVIHFFHFYGVFLFCFLLLFIFFIFMGCFCFVFFCYSFISLLGGVFVLFCSVLFWLFASSLFFFYFVLFLCVIELCTSAKIYKQYRYLNPVSLTLITIYKCKYFNQWCNDWRVGWVNPNTVKLVFATSPIST